MEDYRSAYRRHMVELARAYVGQKCGACGTNITLQITGAVEGYGSPSTYRRVFHRVFCETSGCFDEQLPAGDGAELREALGVDVPGL